MLNAAYLGVMFKNGLTILCLLLHCAVSNGEEILSVDYNESFLTNLFKEQNELRMQVITKSMAYELRNIFMRADFDYQADISRLRKYYSGDDWKSTMECYEYPSCRGYMLMTIYDWALQEYEIGEVDIELNYAIIRYTGTQNNGEKGNGYKYFAKENGRWVNGMSCWIAGSSPCY